jgi:hypothetical protein
MPDVHPAALPIDELLADCEIKKTRRGGPGGQHRNKVESAIVITHLPSKIVGQASERRSQHENREVAVDRLRLNLAVGWRNPVANEQQPSELWRSRVASRKISISPRHADFPTLIAEAMDFIEACDFDVSQAANRLSVTSSQLIKLVKSVPPAFSWLNQNREKFDLGPLK